MENFSFNLKNELSNGFVYKTFLKKSPIHLQSLINSKNIQNLTHD